VSVASRPAASPIPVRSRTNRLLTAVGVLLAAGLVAFTLRAGGEQAQRWWFTTHAPHVSAATPMPASSQIEDVWGIRITLVQLLGDNGLVELRYQVLDVGKANRLHADATSLTVIPTLHVEGTNQTVRPNSLMFHIHNDWTATLDGKVYSIIYGNPAGIVYKNGLVTVAMADGLELRHIPVRG
jgi:hypothetical protein